MPSGCCAVRVQFGGRFASLEARSCPSLLEGTAAPAVRMLCAALAVALGLCRPPAAGRVPQVRVWSAGADPALLQLATLVAKPAFVYYASQLGVVPGEEITTYNLLAIPGKKGAMEVRGQPGCPAGWRVRWLMRPLGTSAPPAP